MPRQTQGSENIYNALVDHLVDIGHSEQSVNNGERERERERERETCTHDTRERGEDEEYLFHCYFHPLFSCKS